MNSNKNGQKRQKMKKKTSEKSPIIGLTGGVGCGKSTVARQFERLGCAVISADELNHDVIGLPKVVQQIQQWWGQRMLDGQGRIARGAVGRVVFEDESELKKLTDLVHPLVELRERELLEVYVADPAVRAVVLDVPLLIEVGQDKWCDTIVFIEADEHIRQERVRQKLGWGPEQRKKVEKLQLGLDIKAEMADYTLRNNSTISDLYDHVVKTLSLILNSS